MGRDLMEEQTLLDLSRMQRETLARWVPILCLAGETELAEEIRATLAATDELEEAA